ncbi:uncharacterized protein PV09_06110 [Verruconis gallopava]|uniref:Major facilitator superfamily (MFS) profile domain-containing protein n=1 Tax=Verruconis gallopava TaxID=253628 RepID=A0A0D2A7E6_9PEZI|nr:uncharacterized protein PV09_06110 [Verruconis gallopava]KIW02673.1 hypothetical protein PV09_06110 [Verruconis gallopava]
MARRASIIDEQTPLLASTAQDPSNQINEVEVIEESAYAGSVHVNGSSKPGDNEDKPLPMGQILVLCISRIVDPVSFFCIFPFLPKMVEKMNVPEADVGFYTGLIESLSSVMQVLTMILWGKAADRYGRKPVLVISNFACAIFTTLFGTSRSIWQLILFRCLSGSFTGSILAVRAMFHELSTPKTEARAFSYFAFTGNLGIFLGPAIGSLARPAEQYPDVFGNIQFFHDWPYVLPCAISGALGLIGAISASLFLKETLDRSSLPKTGDKPKMSTWQLVSSRGVPKVLLVFVWAAMLGFAFTAICPVYFYEPVHLGGFGFSERFISLFISLNGIAQALWLLVAFPPLHKRFGTKALLQGCGLFWGPFMLFFPLNNWLRRNGWDTIFWIIAPINQSLGSGVAIAFTACQLAVNEAAPSPDLLGTLNGVALTMQSAVRAVTPSLFSSIYAVGVRRHILGGQLGMLVLAALATAFFFISSLLPTKYEKISERRHHDEEQANGSAPVLNESNGD